VNDKASNLATRVVKSTVSSAASSLTAIGRQPQDSIGFDFATILHLNIYTTQFELVSPKQLTKTLTWHFNQLGLQVPTISTSCVKKIPNNFYYQFDMIVGTK